MSSARQRTVGHMNKLLAATAAASACSRPDTQSVTIAPLPTVPASTTANAPPPPPTASATLTQPPQPPPPPDPSGYLVVDMLPAPARCLGVAAASKVSGRFRLDNGMWVIDFTVTLPTTGAAAGTKFINAAVSAWSGTVLSSSFGGSNTIANVRVQPGASTTSGVVLGISCGARGNGSLQVSITYTPPPGNANKPVFSLSDF